MDRGSVENLSSTNSQHMNLSRCCQETVDCKNALMDREAIENLSSKQKLSRWIENLSRSYRDKFQKVSMDRRCIKICREKEAQGSRWIVICLEVVKLDKNRFFKEEKNTQMNAIKQTTQPKI